MEIEIADDGDARTHRKSLEDAGGSSLFPWEVLLGFRLLGIATILTATVFDLRTQYTIDDGIHNALFRTLTMAAYIGTTVTFLCLAVSSLLWGLRRGRSIPLLLPAHAFTITFTAYLFPYICWLWANVAPVDLLCLVPLGVYFVDVVVLRSKMVLRYVDGVLSLLIINAVYLACLLIVPSVRDAFSWSEFGILFGIMAGTIALLFFIISLSHIKCFCCDE